MHCLAVTQLALFATAMSATATTALCAVGVCALLLRRPKLRGTTLLAVSTWSLVSLVSICLAEWSLPWGDATVKPPWEMPIRFVAAASTICPTMALLGAKRPQDRGWHFIVLTLWVILSLPAAHWLLFGGVREIHPAQVGLFAILIGAGAINALATRHWLSGLLYALGQVALLGPYLASLEPWLSGVRGPLMGAALISVAWLLVAFRPDRSLAPSGLDRVWLDFRNAFGAVWGLRVMERINASSAMYGWPVTLTWQGFVPRDAQQPAAEMPAIIADSLRTLLRRFVSPEWIDARLSDSTDHSPNAANASRLSASGATP